MPRLAIVSPLCESSFEVRLLRQHGYTVRVAGGNAAADVVLPASRGGSLSFLLTDGSSTAAAPAVERAAQAAKAARRCFILSVGTLDDIDHLQRTCPAGVTALHCESHEEACTFMLNCAQRVSAASEQGAASVQEELERAQHAAADRASAFLAQLWGVDQHHCDFLLAARPLGPLARVASEDDWVRLVHETQGLVDEELLYTAVEWLQSDAPQLW